MGGEKRSGLARSMFCAGSPPRGRGKGSKRLPKRTSMGITPAWAGKSRYRCRCWSGGQDHPRMGGEKPEKRYGGSRQWGSPPRRRGKGDFHIVTHTKVGITPAWAGKRWKSCWMSGRTRDHPRVGGEKVPSASVTDHVLGSPRVGGEKWQTRSAPCP